MCKPIVTCCVVSLIQSESVKITSVYRYEHKPNEKFTRWQNWTHPQVQTVSHRLQQSAHPIRLHPHLYIAATQTLQATFNFTTTWWTHRISNLWCSAERTEEGIQWKPTTVTLLLLCIPAKPVEAVPNAIGSCKEVWFAVVLAKWGQPQVSTKNWA